MKSVTVEITKRIVVTVEAEDYLDACARLGWELPSGLHGASWEDAESQFVLLDIAEGEA